jgi:hypothetical protein
MSKHEQQLKEHFINDLKAPDQYNDLFKKLEIKKSYKNLPSYKKPFFTKPKLIVAFSSFLLLITGFIALSLFSVNAGVPVYKGMEVESITRVSSAYALNEISEPFIDEIESGLVPETTDGISYYAEQGERILVKVNMENPSNHIILSFTLNGFMYQNLDFNEGPELNGIIQIIVEFRVANASGIQNITIDAIKYIDSENNNAIKDAVFDADRTIRVGILYDEIPEILEVSETVDATSFTLDFSLTDPSSLSLDTAFLYVFDGTNIIYTQPVSIGANTFVVSDLMMGHTYEYAITTLFDPLDSIGSRLFILNQGIIETLHGVIPSVTSTQEGVSSSLATLDGVTITSVSLYLNDTLVSSITETNNAYVLEDLLSNTTYELRTTYTYTFNGSSLSQTNIETFTTDAKDIPTIKVLSAVSFGNLVFSTFRVTDVDDTITDLEVRLYKDGDLVQTLTNVTLTPQVANPGTFNASVNLTYTGIGDYLIVVVYTYDLNEGNPLVTVDSLDINADHTLRYLVSREIPELTLHGAATITLEVFSTYTELGASFNDSKDGTGNALISGDTVNTNVVGTYTVLYNYTDTDNNRATQLARIVNVVDTTAPVITLNGNAEITIQAGATYNELGAIVTDNYDPNNVAIIGGEAVDTKILGSYTITYNFKDVNGNAAIEVTRTVTVVDTTAPVIAIDGGNTITLEYLETFVEPTVTVTDNLDEARTITGVGSVNSSILGTYTLTYNSTDTEGNIAIEVILTVFVVDTTAPVITLNGDAEITLQAGVTYTELGAVVTDNYDPNNVAVIGGDIVDTSTLGTYKVTYNFIDSSNNNAIEVIRTINVIDTTAPVITLEGSPTVTIEAGSNYEDLGVTISDNALVIGNANVSGTVDTSILGTYTITYDYTDPSGNDAIQVSRTVEVVDTTPPVITLDGADIITIQAGSVYTDAGATFSDNLDLVGTITVAGDTFDTSVLGEYTITFDAVDTEGNNALQVIRTVTVVDTTPPVIVITGGNSIEIALNGTFNEPTVTLTDNYDADVDLTTTGTLSATIDTSILDAVYTLTYNGTDSLGNVASPVILTIIIVDATAPTADPISTQSFEVKSTPIDFKTLITNASDNVTTTNNLVITETNNVDFDTVGQYEAVITVTDEKGNFFSQTVTVNIVDTTPPVIVITGGNTIILDYLETFVEPDVILTDNYDSAISIKGTGVLSSTIDNSNVGSDYTITYDAQDLNGNNATTVILTIQIRDISAPTFDTIADATIEAGTANIDWTTRMMNVVDTYDDATNTLVVLTEVVDNVNYNVVGTYTVTVKATDSSSNETSQTFNVTVEDTTAPVIALTGSASINVEAGTSFTDPGVVVTDNVAVGNVVVGGDIVDVNTPNTYVITYDYSDPSSNAATQVTRTVIVADTIAPVIILNGNATIYLTVNVDNYTELGATAIDSFDGNLGTVSDIVYTPAINTAVKGTYIVSYSISDAAGNQSSIDRTVIVQEASGSLNNPNQISTTQQFINYFNFDRQLLNNFNKEYFVLMNHLDFENAQLPRLELLGHLDGGNYTISNAIVFSNSSSTNVGFFSFMNTASIENIVFDNITSNNTNTYTSLRRSGLLFGEVASQSGTNTINNITIRNSILVVNTTATAVTGLIAGALSNATVSNITLSNNKVEYRSTDTAQSHWNVSLMIGSNSGTVTISNVSGTQNKLYHNQGNASTNAPGVIIGYALAKSTFNAYLTLSNINTNTSIYLLNTGTRSSWRFGYYGDQNTSELVSSSVTVTVSILSLGSY